MKTTHLIALLLILTACGENPDGSTIVGVPGSPFWRKTAAPEIVAEYYGKRCRSYGFESGTDAMASCIQKEISQDIQSQSDSSEKLQADISGAFDRNRPSTNYTRCSQYRYTSTYSTINCY